jgi:CRP-like cAMP-binding protein
LQLLRREYAISASEEAEILDNLDPVAAASHRADLLLHQLKSLIERYHALNQPLLHPYDLPLALLRSTILRKKRLLVNGLLEIMEQLSAEPARPNGNESPAYAIALELEALSPGVLQDILAESAQQRHLATSWHQRLAPPLITLLTQPAEIPVACSLSLSKAEIATHLEALIFASNPLIQSVALFLLFQLDSPRALEQAHHLQNSAQLAPLLQTVITTVLDHSSSEEAVLTRFSELEKLVYLSNSDFFSGVHSETLIALADRATIQHYEPEAIITEQGDTCRELLLLIEGRAQVQFQASHESGASEIQNLVPGQVLDELEVLSHTQLASTIVAKAVSTRILAVPVDAFDDLLEGDRDFARRVLEMESRRLQQVLSL